MFLFFDHHHQVRDAEQEDNISGASEGDGRRRVRRGKVAGNNFRQVDYSLRCSIEGVKTNRIRSEHVQVVLI